MEVEDEAVSAVEVKVVEGENPDALALEIKERRRGKIVKWIPERGWGLINSYAAGNPAPEKFFVHHSNIAVDSSQVCIGLRVSFTPGSARSKQEFRTAQEVQVLPDQLNVPVSGGAR